MSLWIPLSVILLGLIAGTVAFFSRPPLPRERRRPGAPPAPTLLEKVSETISKIVGWILGGRRGAALDSVLDSAGLKIRPQDALVLTGSSMIVAFVIGLLLKDVLVGLLFMLIPPAIGGFYVSSRRQSRRRMFSDQLDESLQMMAASLRAGYSLQQAFLTVAKDAEQPMRDELLRVVNQNRVGKTLPEGLNETAMRMDSADVAWVSQAIAINREVGGNLANVLDNVSETIRERGRLRRQVKSLSAEGKMSAVVLGSLPPVTTLVFALTNPGYFAPMLSSFAGLLALGVAVLLMAIGIFWLQAVIKIKF